MIEAHNLCKTFKDKKRGRVEAVREVSFQCRPGEIYALLGANGAGKTTTLRMLATILTPTSGDAIIDGASIVRDPEAVRHKVGFLSTATALYGRLSAQEMIDYFGHLHGLQGAALTDRRNTLMQMLEMQDFAHGRCDKLSTGMKQKVSIARTLVHDPPVMIFDEPTLGLDVMAARTIVRFIRDCRDQGKTVIFSTHIMSEVERLHDRIGIIHNGQLLAEGTLAQLQQQTGLTDLEDVFVKTVGGEGVEA
jgi:sodium transport system ATP-binding protein